jgi:hypothetical protein
MSLLNSMNPPPLKFPSFRAAITYHSQCPICLNPLEINDNRIVSNTKKYHEDIMYHNLTFALGDDMLSIDTRTERIDISIRHPFDPIYTIGSSTFYNVPGTHPIPSSGIFIQGFNIDCMICCQFSYTLQMIIDMNEVKLAGIYLNSESITVESDGMIHEVRNVYSTHKTEYSSFSKNGGQKSFSLPIVPLDLQFPQDTISRIRKLIIFS